MGGRGGGLPLPSLRACSLFWSPMDRLLISYSTRTIFVQYGFVVVVVVENCGSFTCPEVEQAFSELVQKMQ